MQNCDAVVCNVDLRALVVCGQPGHDLEDVAEAGAGHELLPQRVLGLGDSGGYRRSVVLKIHLFMTLVDKIELEEIILYHSF